MEESRKAKLRALKILTRMDKTEQELEDALNRAGFSPEAVREAMDYVRSFGYLNDANYARKYVECYKDRKSRQKIRFDLMRKGIGKELVDEPSKTVKIWTSWTYCAELYIRSGTARKSRMKKI